MVRVARWSSKTYSRTAWDELVPPIAAAPLGSFNSRHESDEFERQIADASRGAHEAARDSLEFDAGKIAEKCAQMRAFRGGEHLSEPVWTGLLHVVAKCQDGEVLAHEWSEQDPRYRPEETQQKLDYAERADYKPRTCQWFRENGEGRCDGCQENVHSPISLGAVQPAKAPPAESEPGKRPLPEGYFLRDGQIWTEHLTGSGQKAISVEMEVCSEVYCIGCAYIDGVRKYKWLIAKTGEEFYAERSKCDVRSALIVDKIWWASPKFWDGYVSAATCLAEKMYPVVQLYKTYGWHGDKFVSGEDIESLVEELKPSAKYINRKGELDKSLGAVRQLFDHLDFECYAYPVLLSAGAPLHSLVAPEEGGTILLLRSNASGQGKTTALAGAMSLWGYWQKLSVASVDTYNAQRTIFSQLKNYPIGWDEAVRNTQQFKTLTMEFAVGRPRDRLHQTGELKKSNQRWSTFLIATTNTPYKLQLSTAEGATGGELARVLELNLRFPRGFDARDGGRLLNTFSDNYGHIGWALLQEYEKYKSKIRDKLKSEAEKRAVRLEHTALRLISRQITCAEAAGHMLAKLFPEYFDPENVGRIIRHVEALAVKDFKQLGIDNQEGLYNRFIREAMDHLIRPGILNPRSPVMGGLKNNTLMIPTNAWLHWIANTLHMSEQEAFDRLVSEGYNPCYQENINWSDGCSDPTKCLVIKGKQSSATQSDEGNVIRPPEFSPGKLQ
ncbi:MAG: hypothetical protein C5B60_04800 [Chloroflexi bacterium]|nr:MAG: hypothetical protein C5B60_04800 [Chloroflexota bacterium]